METLWLGIVFVFGAIIGSFLNVVIYRMHTGKSLNGRSHCLSCGHTLRWFELVPIVSYVVQVARCRSCVSWIPSRYVVVELAMGMLYVLIWMLYGPSLVLAAFYAVLIALLMIIVVYDVRHTIIPDELVLGVLACAVVFVGTTAVMEHDMMLILWSVFGGLFSALFFATFWYISKGRWMGLGDAKLAFPLGMLVGFPAAYSMIVIAFVVGAVVSVLILLTQSLLARGKTTLLYFGAPLTIKSEIPFAPFLVLGFLLTHIFHADIFEITFALMPF